MGQHKHMTTGTCQATKGNTQTRQSLCCSHTQSMDGPKCRLIAPLDTSAWSFKETFCAYVINIHVAGSNTGIPISWIHDFMRITDFIRTDFRTYSHDRITIFNPCLAETIQDFPYLPAWFPCLIGPVPSIGTSWHVHTAKIQTSLSIRTV